MAVQSYLFRKKEAFEREWQDRNGLAHLLTSDLAEVFVNGNRGRGTLDYLRLVADSGQIAEEYRRLLLQTEQDYLEFARPPYAVDPTQEPILSSLLRRGVSCRLLFDGAVRNDEEGAAGVRVLQQAGANVRVAQELPLKLALFDSLRGMISLDDPVISEPRITAIVFEHPSLGAAIRSLFEEHWKRGKTI
jgi:hypothetical protein